MVKWAPLNVPLHRRRQTFAVLLWIVLHPLLVLTFLYILFNTRFTMLCLFYIVFILLDPSPERGGRRLMWVRRLPLWRWLSDYFPMYLKRDGPPLDPSKNYLFGYHPHGIIGLGAFTNFGTEANEFSALFPGINLRVLTLGTNFNMPLIREVLLSLGFCSVSRKSCDSILTSGPGNSCMIVVGGAAEALYAFPGKYDLVLKKRMGFIKVALRNGASLVPVIAFGENDLWNQVSNPEGSILRKIQQTFQRYATFSPPLFHGRGIFQYEYGLLPHRKRIVSVVGQPIDCPLVENPAAEVVEKYQELYFQGLKDVFDRYKDAYAQDRKGELNVAE